MAEKLCQTSYLHHTIGICYGMGTNFIIRNNLVLIVYSVKFDTPRSLYSRNHTHSATQND